MTLWYHVRSVASGLDTNLSHATNMGTPVGTCFPAIAQVQEELTLVWLLLIATVLTSFFIQRYQVQFIPPSGAAMILGMVCGGIVKIAGMHMLASYVSCMRPVKFLTFCPAYQSFYL